MALIFCPMKILPLSENNVTQRNQANIFTFLAEIFHSLQYYIQDISTADLPHPIHLILMWFKGYTYSVKSFLVLETMWTYVSCMILVWD